MEAAMGNVMQAHRVGIGRRVIAGFLAAWMAVQPALVSAADGIVPVSGSGTTMDAAGNGVPVVNIATPNASGLSHNRYDVFNVDAQGAILNNAPAPAGTQLGGYIEANPHLAGGSAQLILNEITGSGRSNLLGFLEVAGPAAEVVVANRDGITCNGCGFINTPQATLATGVPLLDPGGGLAGFQVDGGDITFLGTGANTTEADVFALITQSVVAQSAIYADGLVVSTGTGEFDRDGKLVTASNASAPAFAIDTRVLGGIYANRIRLIANQDGVGVRIAAPVAAQTGELQLDAQGVLSVQGAFLSGPQLALTAPEIDFDSAAGIYAGNALLHAGVLANDGQLYAQDELQAWLPEITAIPGGQLQAGNLHLRSDGDITAAGWNYTAGGGLTLTAAGNVQVSDSTLGADADMQVNATDFLLANDSLLYAGGDLGLDLSGNLVNRGLLFANENLRVQNSRAILNGDDLYAAAMIAMSGDVSLYASERLINTGSIIEAINGNVLLGDADRPIPLVENLRTGLLLSAWEHTAEYWSTTGQGNDGRFPAGDAWWLEHCFWRYGFCGDPYMVENTVVQENDYRTALNVVRLADGRELIPLVDYRAFDPAQYRKVTGYLSNQLVESPYNPDIYAESDWWIYFADHENRRFIRQTDYITTWSIADEGRAAQIVAGGDITMAVGTLHNRDSLVSAANDMTIVAGTAIINESTPVAEEIETHWIQRYNWHNYGGRDHFVENVPAGHLAIEYSSSLVDNVASVIEAGGTLTLEGGSVENHGGFNDTGWQSSGLLGGVATPGDPFVPRLPYLGLPNASALFTVNLTPGSRYLVETDPRLATYAGFLGSDYLLSRLGMDPDATMQRLGDGFYELQMIRETLLAMTGNRFLSSDYTDEQAQYLALLDSGVYAAQELQLSLGVALTAEQINALTADMVWMEEREIAGYRVLVPVVYLAPGSAQLRPTGALIAGNTVNVDAGTFANTGTLRAGSDLQVQAAGALLNDHGQLEAGNSLVAVSGGDLVNRGGSLQSGGDMLLASTGGNIRIETPVERIGQAFDGGNSAYDTRIGGFATVQAGGMLDVLAAGSIDIAGAQVAGNGVSLTAGGNVAITSQAISAGGRWQGGDYIDDHVRQLRASISSLSGLLIDAQNDIAVVASTLQANEDIGLYAGHDVLVLAGEESDYAYRHSEKDGRFEDRSATSVSESTRLSGSEILAGGNLSIDAGRDVALHASRAQAGADLAVAAGNNLQLMSGVEQESFSLEQSRSGMTTFRNHQEGFVSQSLAQAALVSGGNLKLDAGGDINLLAAGLQAGDALSIGNSTPAQDETGNLLYDEQGALIVERGEIDNVTVGTIQLTQETWNRTQRGYSGPLQEIISAFSTMLALGADTFTAGQAEIPEVEVGRLDSIRTLDITHIGSQLFGQQLAISAQGQVALVNADLQATDQLAIHAGAITIDAAADVHERTEVHASETIAAIGHSASDDSITLGGVQRIDTRQTLTTRDVVWDGSSLSAGNLVLQAELDILALNAELSALGDAVVQAGGNVMLGGRADEHIVSSEVRTEIETAALALRNAYADAYNTVDAVTKAGEAVKEARDALADAERRHALGQVSDDALEDYRTMVAVAAANLVQATINAAAALASAGAIAVATAGTGLYLSGNASREVTTTTQNSSQTTWRGSSLQVGGDALLQAGSGLDVIGSDVDTTGVLVMNADRINISAGEERSASSSHTETESQSASMSLRPANVSGTVGLGMSSSDTDSSALHYVNSHVTAGSFQSSSDVLRVGGAQITAADVDIETGQLVVASLQDTLNSESRSMGMNLGLGVNYGPNNAGVVEGSLGNASVGYNQANGSRDMRWVDEQTWIVGTDSIRVHALDTTLTGAVIANASIAEDGALTDRGGLDFSTDTLEVNDLLDYDVSSNEGFSFATSMSAQVFLGSPGQKPTDTTTLGLISTGHEKEQINLATLGLGTVVVGGVLVGDGSDGTQALPGLNRDLALAQEITRDQETGALDVTLEIDNRVLAGDFSDIAEDLRNADNNALGLVKQATATTISATGALLAEMIEKDADGLALLMDPAQASKLAAQNPDAAAAIAAYQRGDFKGLLETQQGLQALANLLGVDVNTLVTSVTAQLGLAGTTDHQLVAIDITDANRDNLVNTLGHEVAHNQGVESEWLAMLMGWSTNLGFSAGLDFNRDAINLAYDRLPVYEIPALEENNFRLLYANNYTLLMARMDHAGEFEDSEPIFSVFTRYFSDMYRQGGIPDKSLSDYVFLQERQNRDAALAMVRHLEKRGYELVGDINSLPDTFIYLMDHPEVLKEIPAESWAAIKELIADTMASSAAINSGYFSTDPEVLRAQAEAQGKAAAEAMILLMGLVAGKVIQKAVSGFVGLTRRFPDETPLGPDQTIPDEAPPASVQTLADVDFLEGIGPDMEGLNLWWAADDVGLDENGVYLRASVPDTKSFASSHGDSVSGSQWNEYFTEKYGPENVTWEWPANRGFVYGADTTGPLVEGQYVVRYGPTNGSFVTPLGTDPATLSMAPGTDFTNFNIFQITKTIPNVRMGPAAPAFDMPGYGMQYDLRPSRVSDLSDYLVLIHGNK